MALIDVLATIFRQAGLDALQSTVEEEERSLGHPGHVATGLAARAALAADPGYLVLTTNAATEFSQQLDARYQAGVTTVAPADPATFRALVVACVMGVLPSSVVTSFESGQGHVPAHYGPITTRAAAACNARLAANVTFTQALVDFWAACDAKYKSTGEE